mgnify:FL=1
MKLDYHPISVTSGEKVPYFSQWESRELVQSIVNRTATARDDPNWVRSGAPSVDEYAKWAGHLCGIACLRMILASYCDVVPPAYSLAMQAKEWGAYTEQSGDIRGLIYQPLVEMVQAEYGLQASVFQGESVEALLELKQRSDFVIASVHHSIRTPEILPPKKGGHLVLIHGTTAKSSFVLHNPSGHTPAAQENAVVSSHAFDKFFAGRGITIQRKV